jgi:hypothetical protein
MAFFSLVERVMMQLSSLPGLGILRRYVLEFQSRQASINRRVSDVRRQAGAVRSASAEVAQAARGSKRANDDDEDEEEDESADDFESYMQ